VLPRLSYFFVPNPKAYPSPSLPLTSSGLEIPHYGLSHTNP
jgi:hypothetical protein